MMSGGGDRLRVAQLCAIPDDIRLPVAAVVNLFDANAVAAMDAEERSGIALGLTMAMHGAPEPMLSLLPKLKRIVSCGAGTDRYDMQALARRGIEVFATADIMTEDTADMAVALIYATLRRIVRNDEHVRSGAWARGRAAPGTRVGGKTVGIVGLGRIGRRVAEKLEGIGAQIRYTGRTPKADAPWHFDPDPVTLSRNVDILVLTCAGGEATRHLVDEVVLRELGPEGFVINVSRGSVIAENALLEALETGAIGGAGLDVFETEPSPEPRFLKLANVVLQPHAATLTGECRAALAAEAVRLLQMPSR